MLIDYEYQRERIYKDIFYYIKMGAHFEYDHDYDFFLENIAKKGVDIYFYYIETHYHDYKTTIKIKLNYMSDMDAGIIHNTKIIDLESSRYGYILPIFERED